MYDAVRLEACVLQLVDEHALHVALIVVDLHVGILTAELVEILLERGIAVDAWLACAEHVKVWSVDDCYFHRSFEF